MIGLLQMRQMPNHQTKGPGCRGSGQYDLESLCTVSVSARRSDVVK